MSVRMFKIISGEFVIAETKVDISNNYVMSSPMMVNFAPHPSGQLSINMFPLNPFATSKNEEVTLKDNHVMFEVAPQEGLEKEYIKITSGIITSKSIPGLKT